MNKDSFIKDFFQKDFNTFIMISGEVKKNGHCKMASAIIGSKIPLATLLCVLCEGNETFKESLFLACRNLEEQERLSIEVNDKNLSTGTTKEMPND